MEIPSVEGPAAMAAVLEAAQTYGVTIHRVSQGSGMMLLTDAELHELASLGARTPGRSVALCGAAGAVGRDRPAAHA